MFLCIVVEFVVDGVECEIHAVFFNSVKGTECGNVGEEGMCSGG